MGRLKIKLDNMDDGDGMVLITCSDRAGAQHDRSIAGSKWEVPADMDIAYAIVTDHKGLVEELEKDGYEVDDSIYCPPD